VTLDDPHNSGSVPGNYAVGNSACRSSKYTSPSAVTGAWNNRSRIVACPFVGTPIRVFCAVAPSSPPGLRGKTVAHGVLYREMRRKSRLLLNGDGTPVGGAWNFDAENRKSCPKA
jgi:deoxyribodipyrimidine photolyase-related protein